VQVSAPSSTPQGDPLAERKAEFDLQEPSTTSCFASVARLHSTNRHSTGEYLVPLRAYLHAWVVTRLSCNRSH